RRAGAAGRRRHASPPVSGAPTPAGPGRAGGYGGSPPIVTARAGGYGGSPPIVTARTGGYGGSPPIVTARAGGYGGSPPIVTGREAAAAPPACPAVTRPVDAGDRRVFVFVFERARR